MSRPVAFEVRLLAGLLLTVLHAACGDPAAPDPVPSADVRGVFAEVATRSGVEFHHRSGADGAFLLPEIMGGGAGFLDYDSDGFLDLYLVQSGRIDSPDAQVANRLFRNDGSGGFVDVTAAAGVSDPGYGMGCAAGDYDNDGDVDLYVTNLGANTLYRNEGNGTFTDVTQAAGVGDPGWSTSAAFVDYDADGDLDLFVTNYVLWSDTPAFTKKECFATTGANDYCSPQSYEAPSFDTLYRNDGGGKFRDVSAEAGIRAKAGTGLGVVCVDLNGDGRIDIYVANDQMPSFAWIGRAGGTFVEQAIPLGIAVDETGRSQAGMGVATGDIDDDGDFDLWKVHLYRESHILYVNRGHYFDDATSRRGLAAVTRPYTGFGTALFDFDLDGRLDLFVANGRVQVVPGSQSAEDLYAEPNQLLRQGQDRRFADISADLGPAFALTENSRAAAVGDYDNDGDLDILVANRDGPARLLRNDAERRGGFLSMRVLERHGRDAYGARVTCILGDAERTFLVGAAYSYCATNDPRVHVGLGSYDRVDRVEVLWPDGTTDSYGPFDANSFVELRQK